MTNELTARPFLKWIGGKRQLLQHLMPLLAKSPAANGMYHEPFLGGGAVFFALRREQRLRRVRLSDVNTDLIETYRAVRDSVDDVILRLREHQRRNSREYFYEIRRESPSCSSAIAARLIYLNRTCFNGLYRTNQAGQFNAPWGGYVDPNICDEANLRLVSTALRRAVLESAPFEAILGQVKPGALVYLDPPYVPVSATASFTKYNGRRFGLGDQERLSRIFFELDKNGIQVVLTNSDSEVVRHLYQGARIQTVLGRRSVNVRGDRRGPVPELIVSNF